MRRFQLTGLVFGTAVLFFAVRPATAQVWVQPSRSVMIAPAPVVVAPGQRVVVPAPVVVNPSWRARRYRPFRRRYWYAPAWGPPATVVRRW